MNRILIAAVIILAIPGFDALAQEKKNQVLGLPFVGLQYGSVLDIRNEFEGEIEIPKRKGVLVTRVMKRGPAYEAGLRPLDVIIAVNNIPVQNQEVFKQFLDSIEVGRRYKLSVIRPRRASGKLTWKKRGLVALEGKTFRSTALIAVTQVNQNGEMVYKHLDSPKSLNTKSSVDLYFTTKNGDSDQLNLRISHVGEKHLNINRFVLKYGDESYEIDASEPEEVLRDEDGLDFWEWRDRPVEKEGFAAFAGITQKRDATISYIGTEGTVIRDLSADEIDRLLLVLVAYQLRK